MSSRALTSSVLPLRTASRTKSLLCEGSSATRCGGSGCCSSHRHMLSWPADAAENSTALETRQPREQESWSRLEMLPVRAAWHNSWRRWS